MSISFVASISLLWLYGVKRLFTFYGETFQRSLYVHNYLDAWSALAMCHILIFAWDSVAWLACGHINCWTSELDGRTHSKYGKLHKIRCWKTINIVVLLVRRHHSNLAATKEVRQSSSASKFHFWLWPLYAPLLPDPCAGQRLSLPGSQVRAQKVLSRAVS